MWSVSNINRAHLSSMDLTTRYSSLEEQDSRLGQIDDQQVGKGIHSSAVQIEVVSCSENDVAAGGENLDRWNKNKVLFAWLSLCFSTGPTSSMSKVYVPVVVQSFAHALGHQKGSQNKCTARGDNCYVRFGSFDVQFTSYVLYLKAIYTALEGLVAILVMTCADYSNNRRSMLAVSVITFGLLACPFAALYRETFVSLISVSVLYCLMLIVETVYQIIEGSYIPIFMLAAGQRLNPQAAAGQPYNPSLRRGSIVSALGLIMGNLGGIIALTIGVIITHIGGPSRISGPRNFMSAITVAGFLTLSVGMISMIFIPRLQGQTSKRNVSESKIKTILKLPFTKLKEVTQDVRNHREVLKYLVAWVLWNISFSNFLSVNALMFRSTLGLNNSSAEFTVWQLMGNIMALLGSLVWMLVYNWQCRRFSDARNATLIKRSLCILLLFGWFANFWGALGANADCPVGFKHRWEFWVGLVFFMSTSSGLRSIHRVVYSSMLPKGKENQFFGLEIMLGLLTGWTEPLIIAAITNRTGNSRLPYIPNTILFTVAIGFFYSCDITAGMKQVAKT
ncbi:LAFA_0F02586g1_1 [Lachancea sp. 'fantastica']|nr:LAFA_0F02586g1_1 [Lachancea sp. 'fantastica']